MKILSAKIDWLMDLGNLPKLIITVDKLVEFDVTQPIYTRQPNGMVYAIKEGFIDFISMGQPTESGAVGGFGGREMVRTLTDGTVLKSRDCWSGSSSVMGFECKEVVVYETQGDYPRIGTAVAVTYELAKQLIDEMEGVYLIPYVMAKGRDNESHWWVASKSPTEYTKQTPLLTKADFKPINFGKLPFCVPIRWYSKNTGA
mgnify:CR=1 FL=1|tara:strand:- start:568 stop:1170 length:603 start_codon:yes stop_codon:yes gene_type:complete